MNEKVKSKKQRIIYYSVLAVMLLLICAVTVIALSTQKNQVTVDNVSSDSSSSSSDPSPDSSSPDPSLDEDPQPVVEVISFIMPVENGTLLKEYTENTVIYSSTLGVYTGHSGMDFKGELNAKVFAVYDGTVESIATSYLQGTTITINHGGGLYTMYNSIEPLEGLEAGMEVKKGDTIGHVSDNNKQEYKDGPHLHFEVKENGKIISPLKYLTVEEK